MDVTSARRSRRRQYRNPSSAAGLGLIEVLIAVLVLAIGLLGIAAMQATALRNTQSSLERSQAVIQTYAILDAMRANPTGTYNLAETCTMPATPDTGANLAAKDISRWLTNLHTAMGDVATTCGSINCVGGVCTVTVKWDDTRGSGGEDDLTVVTVSRI